MDLFVGPQLDRPGALLDEARARGVAVRQATVAVLEHLTSTVTPQGVVGVCEYVDRPLADLPAGADLVVVLAEVRDPGNAGTILRSADAFGADAVVFSAASVDPYNPKTVRASAGSLFHLPIVRGATPEDVAKEARSRGLILLAAEARAERSVYDTDLTTPIALVFGNEAHGIGPEVRALVDGSGRSAHPTGRVPQPGRRGHRGPGRGGPAALRPPRRTGLIGPINHGPRPTAAPAPPPRARPGPVESGRYTRSP